MHPEDVQWLKAKEERKKPVKNKTMKKIQEKIQAILDQHSGLEIRSGETDLRGKPKHQASGAKELLALFESEISKRVIVENEKLNSATNEMWLAISNYCRALNDFNRRQEGNEE